MAQTSRHISQNNLIQVWDHDPGTTAATVTTPDGGSTQRWVDMSLYRYFSGTVFTTVLGGNGPTLVEIVAASDTSGTAIAAITTSGTVDPDAFGDWVFEECSAEQVAAKGAANGTNLRYVALRITCHHSGDEAVVHYLATSPFQAKADLTAHETIA